jgi:hypothetical protein
MDFLFFTDLLSDIEFNKFHATIYSYRPEKKGEKEA